VPLWALTLAAWHVAQAAGPRYSFLAGTPLVGHQPGAWMRSWVDSEMPLARFVWDRAANQTSGEATTPSIIATNRNRLLGVLVLIEPFPTVVTPRGLAIALRGRVLYLPPTCVEVPLYSRAGPVPAFFVSFIFTIQTF
jgi:hypothetical protein